jgi:hypothetical protein
MHPLNSVKGAITTAFVLAVIIGIVLSAWGTGAGFHPVRIDRWLHILSGVMWIGLLYYFNVVQTPGLAAAAADKGGPGGAGISKYIAPRALLWFRWLRPEKLGRHRQRIHAADRISDDRCRRMARNDHAVQRLGSHLAQPKEDPRDRACDG